MFTVVFSKHAGKDIQKTSREEKCYLVDKSISILSQDPYPKAHGNPKKLKDSLFFRLRIGDYRILYKVEGSSVVVYRIQHRKEVYKNISF